MDEIPKSKTQLELEKYERKFGNKPSSKKQSATIFNTEKEKNSNSNTNHDNTKDLNNQDLWANIFKQAFNQPEDDEKITNAYCIQAIIAIISALIFWPLGIYFGITALKKINKNPNLKGKGLAIGALIISSLHLLIPLVGLSLSL